MPTIQHKMFGINDGDFRPGNQSRNQLLDLITKTFAQLPLPVSMIYAPRTDFTNQTANFITDGILWNSRFARSKDTADGGIVCDRETAIGFFNADCPIICIQQGEKLAVLHGGYRCLMRKDIMEEGILETTMREFDPKQVKVFMFGGIGPCCWKPEYDVMPEILSLSPMTCRHPSMLKKCLVQTENTSLLGGDYLSVNLYRLAHELLMYLGVPKVRITVDPRCTCCATKKGEPVYWSHNRFAVGKQEVDGRNLSLAWLSES